jgi:hypothetical protein
MKFDQEEVEPGPWDRVDSFSLAKEAKWFDENPPPEDASKSPVNDPASVSGTELHSHDSNAS